MITCPNCGELNPEDATFCDNPECGALLNPDKLQKSEDTDSFADDLRKTMTGDKFQQLAKQKVTDIMFVFDCTSSMTGEIRAMQDAIIDFAGIIQKEALDFRLGLIEFRDRTVNEEHILHKFNGEAFTKNIKMFQDAVDKLRATGGGPEPESSPDAVLLATRQAFRDCPNRTIVLITDASPHMPDVETPSYDFLITKLNEAKINLFYVVTKLELPRCQTHLKLIEGVKRNGGDGIAFNLAAGDNSEERKEHFIRVLRNLGKSISTKSRIM